MGECPGMVMKAITDVQQGYWMRVLDLGSKVVPEHPLCQLQAPCKSPDKLSARRGLNESETHTQLCISCTSHILELACITGLNNLREQVCVGYDGSYGGQH